MMSKIKSNKKFILIVGIGVLLLVVYRLYPYLDKQEEEGYVMFDESIPEEKNTEEEEASQIKEDITQIIIDVKGAVKYPGVYEMSNSERVNDALKKAGGILAEGEENAINFAMKLTDEMIIYVPFKGEEAKETMSQELIKSGSQSEEEGEVININHASEEELQEIPGIGPSKAKAIIEYRETNGSFSSKEDLKEISGIGDKTYEKLERYIKVN